jgi:hypothetical protein
MNVIKTGVLALGIIGLTGCAAQETTLSSADSQLLRDDFSCDAVYVVVETCNERGASYDVVEQCEGLSDEWGKAFNVIDAEAVDIATELCMISCESGFEGETPPSVAEVCAES